MNLSRNFEAMYETTIVEVIMASSSNYYTLTAFIY